MLCKYPCCIFQVTLRPSRPQNLPLSVLMFYGEAELSSCVGCSYLLLFLKRADLMFSTLNFKSQVDLFFFFGSSNSVSVYVIFSWAPKENRKAFIKGRLFKECYFYTFIFNSLSRHLKRLFHVNKEAYIIKLLLKIRTLLKIPEKKNPQNFYLGQET